MSIIERIDKGLKLYYSSFPNVTYTNADNVGKFKAFCSENYASDDELLKEDLDNKEYTLTTFDQSDVDSSDDDDDDDDNDSDNDSSQSATNHFPLNSPKSDENDREKQIFDVIKFYSVADNEGKLYKQSLNGNINANEYTHKPFHINNGNEQKYNCDLFQFTDNTFCHILEDIHTFSDLTKSQNIRFPTRKRWRGTILKLNEKQKKQSKDNSIEIKINETLQELITLSKPFKKKEETQASKKQKRHSMNTIRKYEQNTLFNRDFTSLLIDSFHRYCIITQIMDIENTIQKRQHFTYSQLYWQVTQRTNDPKRVNPNATNKITKYRLISNKTQFELETEYKNKVTEPKNTGALVINGKKIKNCFKGNGDIKQVFKDYENIVFKFMSSHKFYWLLAKQKMTKQKNVNFFKYAFNTYKDAICGPLTLTNINKINDNIFVFWMYIWSMSNVVKTYMQSGDIKIPLQIDLMIISADNNDRKIDNISERFNLHNQKFETVLCDPTNIDSIRQKLESIFLKCTIKMKKKEHRVVIIVDRRRRHEYFKDKNYDRIYGYKPLMKYCQIDKKYEIINAIWNTSTYLLPPPPTQNRIELIGAKNMKNLFVFTYFIRKKSQFSQVFNFKEEKQDTQLQQNASNIAQLADDSTIGESIAESFTTADTLDIIRPQGFKTKKAQDIFQKMYNCHQNNQLTSVKLHELLKQVQTELQNAVIPNSKPKMFKKSQRSMTVSNIQVITEFQKLQNHILQVAMARSLDSVVNMYVFYNGGYFRFEPWDLVRILPKLFNINDINNYRNMVSDFKKYNDKLWELNDEIWMKYNEIYLGSKHAMKQKVNEEEFGTDPNDRNVIKQYCMWNKNRLNQMNNEVKMDEFEMKYDENINIIQNDENVKEIELKCGLNEFIEWKSKGGSKGIKAIKIGMIVNGIKNKNYKQLLNLGNKLWSIWCVKYDNKTENVSEMKWSEINKLLDYLNQNKIYPYRIQLIGGFFKICDNTENKIDVRVIELKLKLSAFLEWIDNSKNNKIGSIKKQTSGDKQIAMDLKQLHKKKENGFKISNINNNEYGNAFKETGVIAGWYIKEINNIDVSKMVKSLFKQFLKNDIDVNNGYKIKFIYPDRTLSIASYSSKRKIFE